MTRALGVEERALSLATLATLIYRYTQQQSFYLRVTPVDGKDAVVLARVDDDRTVRQLAQDLSAAMSAAAPGEARLAEGRERLPVAVVFGAAGALAGSAAGAHPGADGRDLHLTIAPRPGGGGGFDVCARYNAKLFYRATIERLGGHLGILTEALAHNLDSPVSALPLLGAEETRTLLSDWASRTHPYPARPLHQYVEAHAVEQPDAFAVAFNDTRLTYAELNRRANQVAHYLLEHGIKPGDRVAVCVEPSLDIAVCVLGIFKAGGTHVPLDPTYPQDRLSVILDDTRPVVLLAQSRPLANLPPVAVPTLCLDRDGDRLDRHPGVNPGLEIDLQQTAFIIYTSGTTGKPKGVMLTHANLIHYVLVAQERYGFNRADVMPAFARFTFSITMFELFSPLVAGGRLVVLERDHVLDFKRLVPTLQQSTVMHASPSLLRKLLAYIADNHIAPASFANLRHVSSGGDMVSADLIEALKRVFETAELFVIYGCSEIACMGCTYEVPRDRAVTRSKVGKPFDNVSVRLYDQRGNMVPIGVAGEICFAGAGVARGYLNREDLTREKFATIDGQVFYRTGDIGRFDADGNLEILGRSDFQIKLRGIRIELGDIEATLRQMTGVREGVVAARELGGEEKSLVAYVVPDPSRKPNVKDIRRFLQVKLPDYMVPTAYVVMDALPVNMNQKVDRRALPEPTAEDLARLRTFDPPRNPRERKLVEIWERVLGVSPIGVKDTFFDAGGNSLQSVALMVEIEKAFGQALPLSAIMTDPTIEMMAVLLDPDAGALGEPEARPSVVPMREGGPLPPIFFVHDGEGEIIPYRNLALRLSGAHPVYGIQPLSKREHPILHTRLTDIVDYYTQQIRRVQPVGPYILGGLCIGGFIAFEIARKLQSDGQEVAMIALLDAAHVTAPQKSLTARRFQHFSAGLKQQNGQGSAGGGAGSGGGGDGALNIVPMVNRALQIAQIARKKATNVIRYEVKSRAIKQRNNFKMRLFRFLLDSGLPLPKAVQRISVNIVLHFAEKEYVIPERRYPGSVILYRATKKDAMFDGTLVDDTPYVDLQAEPLMGWADKAAGLETFDLPGGHSSMLVPPYVDAVAGLMQKHIDAAMERCRSSLRIDASAGQRAGAPPPTTMDGPGVVGTPAGPAATAETA